MGAGHSSPTVASVRHKALPTAGDSGFAISIVPESDSGPHMAKLGEDRYYKRSGDSFYKMEHFDLEDMFGRRKKPILQLTSKYSHAGGGSTGGKKYVKVQVTLVIENIGRGIAKSPLLIIDIKSKHRLWEFGIDGNGNFGMDKLPHARGSLIIFGGSSTTVIHPGTYREVCAITQKIEEDGHIVDDIILEYELASEDSKAFKGIHVSKKENILECANEYFTSH